MAVNKDEVRDSIADLLMDNDINVNEDIDSQTLTFQRTPASPSAEVVTLEQSRQKAAGVMNTLMRLYLSEGYISKSEYVQAKVKLDTMTLGSIMNQMEISQRAISVLMENIELGDINPKLFDAMGKLQSTFIELVKTQTNYIQNAGNEYEKMAISSSDNAEVDTSTAKEIASGYKSSSQKDLMQMIMSVSADKK